MNNNDYYKRSNELNIWDTFTGLFIVGVVIFLIIAVIGGFKSCTNNLGDEKTITATVTDKYVKRVNKEDKYLVSTKDNEGIINVFEITDSLALGRFNSADVYSGIEVGKTYTFTVVGERNEFYSIYPNIKEYYEVTTETSEPTESTDE